MQRKWRISASQIVYIGDNCWKDSKAPKQLGMKYLLFDNKEGLYFISDINGSRTLAEIFEEIM